MLSNFISKHNNKIELITMHCVKNYGSVLQTYATQEYLKNLGLNVEVLDFKRHDLQDPYFYVNEGLEKLKEQNKPAIYKWIYKLISSKVVKRKIKVFDSFLNKYINLSSKTYLSEKELFDDTPKADIYCVGSDQMWNKVCNHGFVGPFFLSFVPDDKKKISFSSSFGREKLDEDEIDITKKHLKKFDAISVRENSGLDILKSLDINNGVHILDPTILLTKEEWAKLTYKNLAPQKPYLLIYELGKNDLLNDCANKIAREKGLKIIRIGIGFSQIIRKNTIVFPEVKKWLSLFRYAKYVVTDSFHGTAFSINFNKQFQVVYPKNFSTRLQSIVNLFGLDGRVIHSIEDTNSSKTLIDYNKVNDILDQERLKAKNFVCCATNIKEISIEQRKQ